jgi:hypothetical protein
MSWVDAVLHASHPWSELPPPQLQRCMSWLGSAREGCVGRLGVEAADCDRADHRIAASREVATFIFVDP